MIKNSLNFVKNLDVYDLNIVTISAVNMGVGLYNYVQGVLILNNLRVVDSIFLVNILLSICVNSACLGVVSYCKNKGFSIKASVLSILLCVVRIILISSTFILAQYFGLGFNSMALAIPTCMLFYNIYKFIKTSYIF